MSRVVVNGFGRRDCLTCHSAYVRVDHDCTAGRAEVAAASFAPTGSLVAAIRRRYPTAYFVARVGTEVEVELHIAGHVIRAAAVRVDAGRDDYHLVACAMSQCAEGARRRGLEWEEATR